MGGGGLKPPQPHPLRGACPNVTSRVNNTSLLKRRLTNDNGSLIDTSLLVIPTGRAFCCCARISLRVIWRNIPPTQPRSQSLSSYRPLERERLGTRLSSYILLILLEYRKDATESFHKMQFWIWTKILGDRRIYLPLFSPLIIIKASSKVRGQSKPKGLIEKKKHMKFVFSRSLFYARENKEVSLHQYCARRKQPRSQDFPWERGWRRKAVLC